jgi:hypothetical protein
MKVKATIYWVVTVLLSLVLLSGGAAEVARRPETIKGMVLLGYPVYFVVIIGCWKIAGAVALLAPGWGRLKEWAYAGIFFNMSGAAISHAVCGDAAFHLVATLLFTVLTLVSWALRPPSRIVGQLGMAH